MSIMPAVQDIITKDNRVKKENIYKAVRDGSCFISYSSGIKRRRKIEDFS
jgi:hypothetical protein